jgi:L-lactate utilization protein LutC
MNFFKKLFNLPAKEESIIQQQEVKLSLDDLFVHNFVEKGGKFLYCLKKEEVIQNTQKILSENNWEEIFLLENKLSKLLDSKKVKNINEFSQNTPIFSTCEHLIADSGDVLFSSNQLGSRKLNEYPENFIIFATTSQLVKDTGQGLTGIKSNFSGSLPTNISAVKNYIINKSDDNFLNYGNSNSKNLYLLLLEDL